MSSEEAEQEVIKKRLVDYKWYTVKKAEADGVLEIKCRHCSKTFQTEKGKTIPSTLTGEQCSSSSIISSTTTTIRA